MASCESFQPKLVENDDSCCCCLGEFNLRNLFKTYRHNGQAEVYSDMINKCYGLEVFTGEDNFLKDFYLICEICVTRLRNAFIFRQQMEFAYESFQKYLVSRSFNNKLTCESNNETPFNRVEIISDSEHSHNYYSDFENDDKPASPLSGDSTVKLSGVKIERNNSATKYKTINSKTKFNVRITTQNPKQSEKRTPQTGRKGTFRSIKVQKGSEDNIKNNKNVKEEKTKRIEVSIEKLLKLDKSDITCKICNVNFLWHQTLKIHMATHYPNHICHMCGKYCVTKKGLNAHIINHLDTKERICEICNKTFIGSAKYHMHKRSHNVILHKCPKCPERLTSFYKKIKHLIDVHGDETHKYKCKLCPKRFLYAGTLSQHVRKNHLQEKNHKCTKCPLTFYGANCLRRHMVAHTANKDFRCDVCHKAYARRSTLVEHLKIHYNIKDYVCPICNKAFTQKCTLKGHMKVHEKE